MAKPKPKSRQVPSTREERSIRAKLNFGHVLTRADCAYVKRNPSKFTPRELTLLRSKCGAVSIPRAGGGGTNVVTRGAGSTNVITRELEFLLIRAPRGVGIGGRASETRIEK